MVDHLLGICYKLFALFSFDYSTENLTHTLHMKIVRLEGSFMVWVMTTPVMSDLTVSIPNRDVSCPHFHPFTSICCEYYTSRLKPTLIHISKIDKYLPIHVFNVLFVFLDTLIIHFIIISTMLGICGVLVQCN